MAEMLVRAVPARHPRWEGWIGERAFVHGGKPRWENCCGSRGAEFGCRDVPCQPLQHSPWGSMGCQCMCPAPYEIPFQKVGRWVQHPPCAGHPPETQLFRGCSSSLLLPVRCSTSRSKALGRLNGLCCICILCSLLRCSPAPRRLGSGCPASRLAFGSLRSCH